jgi:hypothetical protein
MNHKSIENNLNFQSKKGYKIFTNLNCTFFYPKEPVGNYG